MRSQVSLHMDEPAELAEFEVKANGRIYKFKGRISNFQIDAQRDYWFDVNILNRPRITRPTMTFEIEGEVVGELRTEEPLKSPQHYEALLAEDYSSFPQRYALGISDAMQETGKQMTEGLVRGLQTCDHMCSCTSECLSDCPSLCGD